MELFKKNLILTIYTHSSKGRNSPKNCSIDQFFFYRFQISFLFFTSYSNVNILKVIQEKLISDDLYTYFKGPYLRQKLVDWPDFFYRFRTFQWSFFLFYETYNFLNIMKRKCQKTQFCGGHLGFLAAILDWQWGIFNPVFYSW